MNLDTSGYPIPYHETWQINDSTKVQDYLQCPRSFFYKYALGWESEEPNIHLIFGQAWHAAQEHLLLNGYGPQSIVNAYNAFLPIYRLHFPKEADALNYPKVPSRVLDALPLYVLEWGNRDSRQEVLYTEIAGTVPVLDGLPLYFRMDSILRIEDLIRSREHKTGSRDDRSWRDKWTLKTQVGTYLHVLYCLYPADLVWGVEINGAIFSKKDTFFPRIPIRKKVEAMETWWWNTQDTMRSIYRDYERLHDCSRGDSVLKAFPMNTESCTDYFGCKYHGFCASWSNPLQYVDETPIGFTVRRWNPMTDLGEPKVMFELPGVGS